MKIPAESKPYVFFIASLLLALPAFLINLGLSPVIDDEAIRGLVAFEMIQKGDYVTPTISGEIYLKKPPLFNWLIVASFDAFGNYGEIPLRIPMIISLFLFTLMIFYFFKKEFGTEFGIINALLFLTCGRIIIYESLHGLIDITFSMLTFFFFMMIYRAFNQGRLLKLFIYAYTITAVAFLLKGLPSVVFLGISLLVLFIWQKKFKLLFNWRHFAGIGFFLVIVGTYYFVYFTHNKIAPADMLDVLIGETTRRTAIRFGIWKTILHLLSFPFEMIYHFLPWSLFSLLLFRKNLIKKIKSNPFATYLSLIFIFNILVYWSSPEVYPRYILMLVPLYFGVCTWFYLKDRDSRSLLIRIIEVTFGIVLSLSVLVPLLPLFVDIHESVPNIYLYSIVLLILLAIITWLYWKQPKFRIYWMVIALLVLRTGFDLIVLPVRHHGSDESEGREIAAEIINQAQGEELYFWWNPEVDPSPYYGKQVASYRFTYYLSTNSDRIIPITSERKRNTLFISQGWAVKKENVNIIREFLSPGNETPLVLFTFRD